MAGQAAALAVARTAMETPGYATTSALKFAMDCTTNAHATVDRASGHAASRCNYWRGEMCAGETRPGDAMGSHSRAILDRRRAAENLHGRGPVYPSAARHDLRRGRSDGRA
jgi:hypothetical protein